MIGKYNLRDCIPCMIWENAARRLQIGVHVACGNCTYSFRLALHYEHNKFYNSLTRGPDRFLTVALPACVSPPQPKNRLDSLCCTKNPKINSYKELHGSRRKVLFNQTGCIGYKSYLFFGSSSVLFVLTRQKKDWMGSGTRSFIPT